MRRAERLFQLVSLLRGRRLAVTAEVLAAELEVSTRTVYRDVAALQASGVPVEGEAGVGYVLAAGYELPPVMFDRDEVLALLVGGRMVRSFTDPGLAEAAARAEAKIRAILDDRGLAAADAMPYRAPIWSGDDPARETHRLVREAAEGRRKLALAYVDGEGRSSRRVIHPLCLMAWRRVWTLLGWCELRDGYRNFRMDRIEAVEVMEEGFDTGPERSLQHYLQAVAPFDRDGEGWRG